MRARRARSLGVVSALVAVGTACAQYSFTPLPRAIPSQPFFACGLSSDGSTAVGQSGFAIPWGVSEQPALWRGTTQMLPDLRDPQSKDPRGVARAVSADGSHVVGATLSDFSSTYTATEWVNGTPHALPAAFGVPDDGTWARAVSADGSVVVGLSFRDSQTYKAHRWVNGVPSVIPGPPGSSYDKAVGVSADGSVVAGYSFPSPLASSYGSGWIWRDGSTMQLQTPAGAAGVWIQGISGDGSTVVGHANMGAVGHGDRWVAAIWRDGLATPLPQTTGPRPETFGMAISADGSIVVGETSSGLGDAHAFVWDGRNGMRDLNQILTGLGVDLHGWTLQQATGISADGTTILGLGIDPMGGVNSWVAVIPSPGTLLPLPFAFLAWHRRRLGPQRDSH